MTESYQSTLNYIYSFVNYETQNRPRDAVNYDLRRVVTLLERLDNPQSKYKTVHIAGSKGKGSVSALIAAALIAAGYKTGLYTSPHLITFNERIRINDTLISDDEVVELIDRLKPEVEIINREAVYGKLTTFEIITVLGFLYFALNKCDFGVIEVGLGGRLDATNVILPESCAITSISLEHTEILGNTLREIAGEKAGIIKPGIPVVTSPQADEALQVFIRISTEKKARLIQIGRDITWEEKGFDTGSQSLRINGRLHQYDVTIPLIGEYQLENASTAAGVLETLVEKRFYISPGDIARGFNQVKWPGRLQILKQKPWIVADGAHNPYSAAKLRDALKKHFQFERSTLIIGTSSDKDVSGIVSELAPIFNRVIVTRSAHPRAQSIDVLIDEFKRHGITAEASGDISTALPLALANTGEKDLICITGSLFIVAGAIEQLA